MLNFDIFSKGLIEAADCEKFLKEFFTKENYKNYQVSFPLDRDEAKALKILFTAGNDIYERVEDVLEYDPFCLEAFYSFMALSDDLALKYRFDGYYKQAAGYGDMTYHQKICYAQILDYYAQFLYDIDNITGVVRVRNLLYKLTKDKKQVHMLSDLYYLLENDDDYYRLYLYNDFTLMEYLLLIVTLLKHDDEDRAREVARDMFEKNEYARYLDRLDEESDDPMLKEVVSLVDSNYDKLVCAPELFVFIGKVKEDMMMYN